MNDEKKSWLDRAGAVHLWKTIEAMLGTKVDKIEGFGLSSNDYTTEEKNKLASLSDPDVATTENNGLMSSADKAKLDGIEAKANNYTHPVYEPKQAGVYRISVDNTGHVATADKMTSEELTAEGVSPADHTHDLGELVDTLETSADAVEDSDTVIVGATVTSDDGSATTKYTRRPLAALWDWIKSKTDTLYAAAGHTHNYAGSTEPGGDALNAMKLNGYDLSMYGSANYQNAIPRIDDAGVMETGKYLDFHSTDDRDTDYNVRMVSYDDGTLDVIKAAGQPATITANLNGTATNADSATTSNGVKDYNDGGRTIKIGFAGAGLTTSNLNYIAGYTDNGTKIKDVNKDVLKSWLGNGVSASGQNYVRFDDGTQICQGSCGNNSFSSFGAAFANTDYRIGMSEWKSSSWENYAIGGKSTTGVTLRSENNTMEYIAIGRWK